MGKTRRLIILGAGGFGQEIVWAVRNMDKSMPQYEVIGYCDDDPAKKGAVIYRTSVLGSPEEVDKAFSEKPDFICAVGNNLKRRQVVDRVVALGWIPVPIIDPSVIVAEEVTIGEGTYIGAGSILSPYARIGKYVIINHHCSIGHNSILEDFVQISPGGRVSGGCCIKTGASLGSNAVVAPGKVIGRRATLGACSLAMTDVADDVTAVGTPARIFMHHERGKNRQGETDS